MRLLPNLFVTIVLFLLTSTALAQRAVFVVRHAEKASDANESPVPLSGAGSERARHLAFLLRDAGISAIYSTDTVRTRETAEPLAKLLRLETRLYSATGSDGKVDLAPLARRLASDNSADVVLVVGHSNTIAPLLSALGAKETVEIGGGDYDNLFLLIPRPSGPPLLLRMHF
jgi:broad specificity phosphatase PhoE